MKTPLEVLHKYFHHFNSERTRDLVVKAMEDYAKIYHDSEVKKLNIPAVNVAKRKVCPECKREFDHTEVPSGIFCCYACEYGY